MANPGKYDIVIVGGGLGGLLTAVLLAKEGLKVCVLEKNKQIGGCLQTFALNKKVFDSCVHYIGGLGEGHTLNRIFHYAGILDQLELKSYGGESFDRIAFGNDPLEYPHAIGNEHFIEQLLPFFPDEKAALERYLAKIKEVTSRFPMYHLRNGDAGEKASVVGLELTEALKEITDNVLLRQVLMGNNLLYAGVAGKTPFYLHALVMESYMHSAHKVLPGSSQISKFLGRELTKLGGLVIRNAPVKKLLDEEGILKYAETEDGTRYYADRFIAAVHPALLSSLLGTHLLRPAFHHRVEGLQQTISSFMVNMVLKPGTVKYRDYNLYWHAIQDALYASTAADWPANYALYFGEDAAHLGYADKLSVLSYMQATQTKPWEETLNYTGSPAPRGESYDAFKEQYADLLIEKVTERLPELKGNIVARNVATPLTFRDYTGTPDGALYGILKDVGAAARTTINTRTRIPNLFLTGQNVNIHGVLGVSVTAVLTAAEILGLDYLLEKINKGQY